MRGILAVAFAIALAAAGPLRAEVKDSAPNGFTL